MDRGTEYKVLFLCTGNSARSIFAESILNHIGHEKFRGYSAGSHPKGQVHPMALELLRSEGMPTSDLRSKGWDEFAAPAPEMDFVFTVCDQAAGEVCPLWTGRPITAHWGVPDPAAAEDDAMTMKTAFRSAFDQLQRRIRLFMSLRISELDRMALTRKMDEIGKS